jgi:predicted Zn-ribbon and HTH transcriptional regulator
MEINQIKQIHANSYSVRESYLVSLRSIYKLALINPDFEKACNFFNLSSDFETSEFIHPSTCDTCKSWYIEKKKSIGIIE